MKIKVKTQILDYEGKPYGAKSVVVDDVLIQAVRSEKQVSDVVKLFEEYKSEGVTVREIMYTALNSVAVDDNDKQERLSAEHKAQCYQLSTKLFATNEPDFTTKEAAFIIDRVEKIYPSPLICGKINELFNGKK